MLQDVEEHDPSDVVHTVEGGAHGVEVRKVALGRGNATLVHEVDRHRVDLQAVVADTDILEGMAHDARAGTEVDHGARSVRYEVAHQAGGVGHGALVLVVVDVVVLLAGLIVGLFCFRRGACVVDTAARRAVHQHGLGGLEPGPAEALIGLQVVAFCPFVPRHHEDVVLLFGHVGDGSDRPVQPPLIQVGSGAFEDGCAIGTPRCVVPPGHHGREPLVVARLRPTHLLLHRGPVVDDPLAPGAVYRGEHLVAGHGHEAHTGVHAERLGPAGRRPPALDVAEVEVGNAQPLGLFAPEGEGPLGVGQLLGPVDEQHGLTVDLDVAVVLERLGQVADVSEVVLFAEPLRHQDGAGLGVPVARPLFVGPAQGEGEVGGAGLQDLFERALEESFPVEPVVVVDESGDPVLTSQVGLGLTDLRKAEVVVAKFGGDVRLVVPRKEGLRLVHVGPLGKPLAPPLVVLGDRVVLREVEGQGLRCVLARVRTASTGGVPLVCHG